MFFKLIKKIIGAFGYKLIEKNLIKNERLISHGNCLKLENILDNLFLTNKINILIQIGANDGLRFDTLNSFIKKYLPKVVLVEPIMSNYKNLLLNYKSQPNVFYENSAISVENEINHLYKVNETKLINYDDHVAGITSFNKNHLIKHGVKNKDIIKEKINSISINKLLNKYNINEFDLLYIDAEGYDGKIVSDFLKKNKSRPFIIFEYIHINHEILNKTLNLLKEKKFFYFKIDENIISVPEEKKKLISFFN